MACELKNHRFDKVHDFEKKFEHLQNKKELKEIKMENKKKQRRKNRDKEARKKGRLPPMARKSKTREAATDNEEE